jgi:hypothetical protein
MVTKTRTVAVRRLLTFLILVSLAAPAAAETFSGTLELTYELAPTTKDPQRKVEVHWLKTAKKRIPLAELEPLAPLRSLEDRGPITLEGEVESGRLHVTEIVAPSLDRLQGTLYRTKKGWAGQILVRLKGQKEGVDVSGLPWLAFRKMTKDLSQHWIEFDAFQIRDSRGRLKEVVATRVKATAGERLILTRHLLSYRGEVAKGQTVWLTRRSLVGTSALVEGPNGQTGFVLWEGLQIGVPIKASEGAVDQLKKTR